MAINTPCPECRYTCKNSTFYGFFTLWKPTSPGGGVAEGIAIFGIAKNGGHFRRIKRRWEGVLGAES
jgi:hypothetical protein